MVHSSMMTILFIVCLSIPLTIQQCQTNNQANELYSVTNNYYRLALDDYFQGPALNFAISPESLIDTTSFKIVQSQQSQIQTTAPINTVALSSSNLNGDPQVQSYLYNVLAQTQQATLSYTIYNDAISGDSNQQSINYTDTVGTIAAPAGVTNFFCNDIDSYDATDLLVTCYTNNQTTTTQYFYKVSKQSTTQYQINNVILPGFKIQISDTIVSVQGSNTYIYSIISGQNSSNSSEWVSTFQQIQLPATGTTIKIIQIINYLESSDYFTSFQVSSDGTVFLLSHFAGLNIFNPAKNLNQVIPMNYGLLISIYEVQILPNIYNYLIAVAFNGTIIASNNMFLSRTQYDANNILGNNNAKLYINPDYIISTSTLGVIAYPSFFNKINTQQLIFAQNNQVSFSAFNRLTNTLATIYSNGTSQVYNFINPYLTGQPTSATSNTLVIQATSTVLPTTCTYSFIMNVITQAGISQVYPTTKNYLTFNIVYPLPQILNVNSFFQGPSLVFNQTTTSYKQMQYKSLTFPATLTDVSYSQNFIRVVDFNQIQVTNPFSINYATLKHSVTQIVYYTNSTLAIYQVDPYTPEEYYLITSTTLNLGVDVDVMQFTLGYDKNGDLIYGVLLSNGTANVYNFNSTASYEVNPADDNLALVQIEIIDDLFYAVLESDEGDESYSYELQTYVLSDQLNPQQIYADVYQLGYNFPAFGEILFLNQLNQVEIVKNFNNNLNVLTTITYPATITGYPEIAVTEQGLYLISNNSIYFMPQECLFPKTSTQATFPWITIPLYGFNLTAPFIYSTTLKHLYIVVNNAKAGTQQLWVYQNSQNILSTLYFALPLNALTPEWISTVGLSEYDVITFGYEDENGETQDDILLYPSIYAEIPANISTPTSKNSESIVFQGTSSLSNTFTTLTANLTTLNYGLIVTSKFANTPVQYYLDQNALAKIDPRIYFEGNLVFTNVTVPQDQSYTVVYQQPLQMININNSTGGSKSGVMRSVPKYNSVYTFIQLQNYSVKVTPYGFDPLTPNQSISFTSSYQLYYPNMQTTCPLIFIEFFTLNPVSVCYDPSSGNLMFQIKNVTNTTDSVTIISTYQLAENLTVISAEYLQTGLVAIFLQDLALDNLYDLYTFQFIATNTSLGLISPDVAGPVQVYALQNFTGLSSKITIFSMYNSTLSELIVNTELTDGTTYYYGLIYSQSPKENILNAQIVPVQLDQNIIDFYSGLSYSFSKVTMIQTSNGVAFTSNLNSLIPQLSTIPYSTISQITLLNNPTNEFGFVIVPIVISAQGMSYQLDFVFRNYINYIKTQFNCFFQGLYDATPDAITAGNGQLLAIYVNGTNMTVTNQPNSTVYIANYGQYSNLCKNGEILTTISILILPESTHYNVQTFSLLTSPNQISRLLFSNSQDTYLFEATQYLYLWMTPNINNTSVAETVMNATITVSPFNQVIGVSNGYAYTNLNFIYNGIALNPYSLPKDWAEFIWGGIMAIVVFGAIGYMCSKSQNRGNDYAQV